MNKSLLRAPGLVMLLLTSAASYSQNLPPVANNDTVYMCASTITIYVQDNDLNPDGDPLTLSIYAGSINGYFTINGGAINYTPNIGYTGLDSLVYVLFDVVAAVVGTTGGGQAAGEAKDPQPRAPHRAPGLYQLGSEVDEHVGDRRGGGAAAIDRLHQDLRLR